MAELWCRTIALGLISESSRMSNFHSNLEEDLAVFMLTREASEAEQSQPDGSECDSAEHSSHAQLDFEVGKSGPVCEKVVTPEGSKSAKTVKDLFDIQKRKQSEMETGKLDKEMRLDRKHRLESHWKKRRDNKERMRWMKDLVLEMAVDPAVMSGSASSPLVGKAEETILASEARSARRIQAEKEKRELANHLELIWSNLELGLPEWATSTEPQAEQEDSLSIKRCRTGSRKERARDEDRKSRRNTIIAMAQWVLGVVLEQVRVEHDCGMSEACPAWMCERIIKMRRIEERIEDLNFEIANLRLEDDKEKDDPEEDQEVPAISTQVGGGTLHTPKLETLFNTKLAPKHPTKLPTQKKQDIKKIKKKIWTRLKTGLFGWKTISVSSISAYGNQSISGVSEIISDNSKTSRISADVKSGLLTARVGSGGGENNGSELYSNTRSFGKCSYNFNKGNSGVLADGSWVGELLRN